MEKEKRNYNRRYAKNTIFGDQLGTCHFCIWLQFRSSPYSITTQ